jgi:hypothetical protein
MEKLQNAAAPPWRLAGHSVPVPCRGSSATAGYASQGWRCTPLGVYCSRCHSRAACVCSTSAARCSGSCTDGASRLSVLVTTPLHSVYAWHCPAVPLLTHKSKMSGSIRSHLLATSTTMCGGCLCPATAGFHVQCAVLATFGVPGALELGHRLGSVLPSNASRLMLGAKCRAC